MCGVSAFFASITIASILFKMLGISKTYQRVTALSEKRIGARIRKQQFRVFRKLLPDLQVKNISTEGKRQIIAIAHPTTSHGYCCIRYERCEIY
ncbi:hypothetical protein AAMO2058_000357600 [Amorphochlora amoebiformis]